MTQQYKNSAYSDNSGSFKAAAIDCRRKTISEKSDHGFVWNPGRRSGLFLLVSILAALFLILFPSAPVMAGNAASEDDIPPVIMEVTPLYGEKAKAGSHVPVTVRLYGQESRAFAGTLVVSTMESRGEGEAEQYDYEFPVVLNAGETVIKELYIPLGQKNNSLQVKFRDSEGTVLLKESVSFDSPGKMGKLMIGLLSEEPEALSWLNGLSLDYSLVQSETILMDGSRFTEDSRGLELFDMLVINHYNTAGLSEESTSAIREWMEDGGVLLFGSGLTARQTLGVFAEEFLDEPPEVTGNTVISMGVEYAENTPEESDVKVTWTEISMPGGQAITTGEGLPLLTVTPQGRGMIGVFSFDMGELEGFAKASPSFGTWFFQELLGEEKIRNLYFYSSYTGEEGYWNAQSLVNGGSARRLPNLTAYTLVIFGYILIAGPGLYFLLKRRELGRYYGGAVMFTAVLVSALVYLMGVHTRFTSEFFNYATIRDVEGGTVSEISYLNVRTPDSRPYSVELEEGYEITPLTRSSRYDEKPTADFPGRGEGNVVITQSEEASVISSRNSRAFEARMFRLERQAEYTEGAVSSDLSFFDGALSGAIKNDFPFALENAALIFYGQAFPLGRMESGEVRTFSGEKPLTYPVDMNYLLARTLSGGSSYSEVDVDDAAYLEAMEKSGFLTVYLEQYFGEPTPAAQLVGFGPETTGGSHLFKTEKNAEGRILYTTGIQVDNKKDGMVYRSGLLRMPKVTSMSGVYSRILMTAYGTDPVVLEYDLGDDVDVEKVSFLPVSEELVSERQYQYIKNFEGAIWFYNHKTRTYDEMEPGKRTFTGGELNPYFSANGSLTVRYVSEAKEEEEYTTSQMLPYLMVTGRER